MSLSPYKKIQDEIDIAVRDGSTYMADFVKAEAAIRHISQLGLISNRQHRYLLLCAADQIANSVRDMHNAIDRHTAEWEHQRGHEEFQVFEKLLDDGYVLAEVGD